MPRSRFLAASSQSFLSSCHSSAEALSRQREGRSVETEGSLDRSTEKEKEKEEEQGVKTERGCEGGGGEDKSTEGGLPGHLSKQLDGKNEEDIEMRYMGKEMFSEQARSGGEEEKEVDTCIEQEKEGDVLLTASKTTRPSSSSFNTTTTTPSSSPPPPLTSSRASLPSSSSLSREKKIIDDVSPESSCLISLVDLLLSCILLPCARLLSFPEAPPCLRAHEWFYPSNASNLFFSHPAMYIQRGPAVDLGVPSLVPHALSHPASSILNLPAFLWRDSQSSPEIEKRRHDGNVLAGRTGDGVIHRSSQSHYSSGSLSSHPPDDKSQSSSPANRPSSSPPPTFLHQQLSRLEWRSLSSSPSENSSSSSTPLAPTSSSSSASSGGVHDREQSFFSTTGMPLESLHSFSFCPLAALPPRRNQDTSSCQNSENSSSSPSSALPPPSSQPPGVFLDPIGPGASSLYRTVTPDLLTVAGDLSFSSSSKKDTSFATIPSASALPHQRQSIPFLYPNCPSSSSCFRIETTSSSFSSLEMTPCDRSFSLLHSHCVLLGKALLAVAQERSRGRQGCMTNGDDLMAKRTSLSPAKEKKDQHRRTSRHLILLKGKNQWRNKLHDNSNDEVDCSSLHRGYRREQASGKSAILRSRCLTTPHGSSRDVEINDEKERGFHVFSVLVASAVCTHVGCLVRHMWRDLERERGEAQAERNDGLRGREKERDGTDEQVRGGPSLVFHCRKGLSIYSSIYL